MPIHLFPTRAKALVAGVATVVTLFAMFAYVSGDSFAKPSISAHYAQADGRSVVRGVVRRPNGKPVRGARILVRVRNAAGEVIARRRPRVDAQGRFSVRLPKRAAALRVVVRESAKPGPRAVNKLFFPKPGQPVAIDVTAIFPGRQGGLIPGIFPY